MKKSFVLLSCVVLIVASGYALVHYIASDRNRHTSRDKPESEEKTFLSDLSHSELFERKVRDWQMQLPLSQNRTPESAMDVMSKTTAGDLCAALILVSDESDNDKIISIACALVGLGDEAVPDLVLVINCGSTQAEIEAMRILIRIGTIDSVAIALGRVMSSAFGSDLRAIFLKQFANVGTPGVADMLVRMLGEAVIDDLRINIMEILAAMEGSDIVNSLADGLANPVDDQHKYDCALVLTSLNKPSNIGALARILNNTDNEEITDAVTAGLANIGNADACNELVKNAEGEGASARSSAEALANVDSPYGQNTLIWLASGHSSPSIRASAAEALRNYSSSDVKRSLGDMLEKESDPDVADIIEDSINEIDENIPELPEPDSSAGEFVEKTTVKLP